MPSPHEPAIRAAYAAFNARDIDGILAHLTLDVAWANGMEGLLHGHDAARDYWTRQWTQIDPRVDPVSVTDLPDDRVDVEVHQVVKDMAGNVVAERTVHHIFTLVRGKFSKMEIEP